MTPPRPPARTRPGVPRATLAALLILVLSAGISFGYVVQRGGLDLPLVGPTATDDGVAVVASSSPEIDGSPGATGAPAATEAPVPTVRPTSGPSAVPAPTPAITPQPTPSLTASPTAKPTPKPTATATPTPTPAATPKPTSDRYKLLAKCPDRSNCWIYVVRAGDNLFSIGNYFGHSLATIYAWNPQYPETRLKRGAEIRMPPPTR